MAGGAMEGIQLNVTKSCQVSYSGGTGELGADAAAGTLEFR